MPAPDYTNAYNTPLTPGQEFAYQQWLQQQSWANGRDMSRDNYNYDMRGAFVNGAGQSANQHWPDTFKKPNHPTFSDQSQYHGADGQLGGSWSPSGPGWVFTPGPANIQFHGPEGLQAYLQLQDPNVRLNTGGTPLAPPAPADGPEPMTMLDYVRGQMAGGP